MVPVGPSASPRSGPWSVGRWLARSSANHAPLERPPSFALGFPPCAKAHDVRSFHPGQLAVASAAAVHGTVLELYSAGTTASGQRGDDSPPLRNNFLTLFLTLSLSVMTTFVKFFRNLTFFPIFFQVGWPFLRSTHVVFATARAT